MRNASVRARGLATPVVVVIRRVVSGVVVGLFGFVGTGPGQLALEPLEVGLRGAVFKFSSNLGLLCLSPAAAHGGTPSRNNGAAQYLGRSDLCVFIVLPPLYRARLSCAGR